MNQSKWKRFKEVMKNPPQERLCLINARAFLIGILMYVVIIGFIVRTQFWYLSLIFAVTIVNNWVGYKREMKQYHNILRSREMMGITQKIEDDPSPTRRRLKTVQKAGLSWLNWLILACLVASGVLLFSDRLNSWTWRISFVLGLIIAYVLIIVFITYPIAKWRLKHVKNK